MTLTETNIVRSKAWENILNDRAPSETLRASPGKQANESKNVRSRATAKLSTNKKRLQYPLVINTEPISIFTNELTSLTGTLSGSK